MELYHQPESPRLGAVIRGRGLRAARRGVAKTRPPVFTIPLSEDAPPLWPSSGRRYPAAGCKITECDDARPVGRPAPALSAYPRGRAFVVAYPPEPLAAFLSDGGYLPRSVPLIK